MCGAEVGLDDMCMTVYRLWRRGLRAILRRGRSVCSVISTIIVYHAFRDWPVRYANSVLSWSVTAYFVSFVVVSLAGLAAVALYARSKSLIALLAEFRKPRGLRFGPDGHLYCVAQDEIVA